MREIGWRWEVGGLTIGAAIAVAESASTRVASENCMIGDELEFLVEA